MEDLDLATISYLSGNVPQIDSAAAVAPLFPFGVPEQFAPFDTETAVGSEDLYFTPSATFQPQTAIQANQDLSAADDVEPFDDRPSVSESQLAHDQAPSEDASVDADQPLLRFSNISQDQILLDYNCQRVTVSISARLDGYFSLAQSSLAAESDSAMPLDLTCYRRNLLQVTGTVSIPRHLHTILLQHGENAEIVGQELSLSAYESTEGSPVRIIVVPWKTSVIRLAVPSPDDKTEKEPSTIKLDLAGGREVEGDLVMFSFAWKRLQFRIATANNGRRKELQQHFVIKLQVFVHLRGGSKISVCSAESMPTIVRGRSPRNFQSRRDFPLSSGSVTGKRSTAKAPQPARSKTGEPGKSQAKRADRPAKSQQVQFKKVKTSPATKTVATSKSSEHNEPVEGDLQPHHYVNWKPQYCQSIPTSLHSRQAKEMASGAAAAASAGAGAGATGAGPGIGGVTHPHTLSDLSHVLTSQLVHGPISAPIDLSVLDEEQPRRASASSVQQNKAAAVVAAAATTPRRASQSHRLASFTLNMLGSPEDAADRLYEYFPLSVDDWLPPVDAVYRPHVVHHTVVPLDQKSLATRKSKRYFSEDQS